MKGVLERILDSKRREIEALAASPRPTWSRTTLDVRSYLQKNHSLTLVAEIKHRSPSAGELPSSLGVAARAHAYALGGASMVSVLCDGPFFGGSYAHLALAREALDAAGFAVPLLAKEFVLAETQLDQARAHGADAVLVIVRILPPERLAPLISAAIERGLAPLVEVVTEEELGRAIGAGARVVGVNARDLDTLAMDPARAASVLSKVPEGVVAVHLSGIKSERDVAEVAKGRADAALVGETLMLSGDPTLLLKRFIVAGRRPA